MCFRIILIFYLVVLGHILKTVELIVTAFRESNTHYLYITGEINIYLIGKSIHEHAIKSNVVICLALKFDVIPTYCLASKINDVLPKTEKLILEFESSIRKSVKWNDN